LQGTIVAVAYRGIRIINSVSTGDPLEWGKQARHKLKGILEGAKHCNTVEGVEEHGVGELVVGFVRGTVNASNPVLGDVSGKHEEVDGDQRLKDMNPIYIALERVVGGGHEPKHPCAGQVGAHLNE